MRPTNCRWFRSSESRRWIFFPSSASRLERARAHHAPVPASLNAAADCGVIVIDGRRMMTNNNLIYFVCPPRANVAHAVLPPRQLSVNLVLELPLQTLAVSSAGTRRQARVRADTHIHAHTHAHPHSHTDRRTQTFPEKSASQLTILIIVIIILSLLVV